MSPQGSTKIRIDHAQVGAFAKTLSSLIFSHLSKLLRLAAYIAIGSFVLMHAPSAPAQHTGCEMLYEDTPEPQALNTSCGISINYAPLNPAHVPIKYSRMAFHVLQDDNGLDGFQNVPADIDYLRDVEERMNQELAGLGVLQIGSSPFISDSRLRVIVENIYFHRTTAHYLLPDININAFQIYVLNDVDGIGYTEDEKWNVEHIFIKGGYVPDQPVGGLTYAVFADGSQSPYITDVGHHGWIRVGGWYSKYLQHGSGSFDWPAQNLVHEMCHAWGLKHNYIGGGPCDPCTDNDATGGGPCPAQGASNNYMDVYPSGWTHWDAGLSECQLGIMHYRLDGNEPSRTIHRVVLKDHCDHDPVSSISITDANQVWLDSKKLKGDLIVEPGATLTVKCRVHMPSGSRVIVKQGGRLIIDEGQFTNLCDEFWQGIEAWGTTNQHQYPANQPTYQGLVVLKNGALVEHALVGFTNWRPGVKASRGGVLQVQGTLSGTGGTFLNCRRGVEFKKYRNFHPSNPSLTQNNLSYFRHADFIVDTDYRGGDDFDHHVDLWDVTGISFTQCDFFNTQTSGVGGINESHKLGTGIFSLDATFSVYGQCAISLPLCEYGSGLPQPVCPEQDLRRSRFLGLDHGIHATSSGMASRTFTVRDSHFENNICGVFSEGVDNGAMLRNIFVVGGRDVADLTGLDDNFQGKHRAIYTTTANAFRVEENHLQLASPPLADVEGVVVGSTNAYNDQVYKNYSHGMHSGFVAENDCVDWNNPVNTGLSLLCNQNSMNQEEDFRIRSSFSPALNHCIKMFQGSTSRSAGNTFTPAQNGSSSYYNYHNEPEQLPITYFWQAAPGDLNPSAYNTPWVQRHTNISPANSCPTRITCGGGPQVRASLQPQMDDEQLAYLNLKYVYESLLDGGDFEELKETIMESWPQDAWELRNTLMEKSPYLSVEILKEAGLKNILPHAMYLEVCLANPEGTQRGGFVKWVQYEMPNPLPEYMVAQVVASWDQKTWRTSLESAMGWHQGEYQRLNDHVIGTMLNDTVPQPPDSLRIRLQLNSTLRARYAEAATMLEQGDHTAAEALLAGLDATYKMGIAELQERDDMLALIAVVRNAEVANRSIMELDNAEVAALETIAAHQPSRAATHARGILCFGYGICTPPITGGTAQPKSRWTQPPTIETSTPSILSVHPNPASTWVAFSHTLTGTLDRAYIRVLDAHGKEVYGAPIATSPGQSIWDTRGVAAGTYTVELHNKAALVETQRVVVRP